MKNKYMNIAIEEAKQAALENEVPVGAVIVRNNEIICRVHNTKQKSKLVCSHAEILAIEEAIEFLNDWRLNDCELYVTLEPCPMCSGAIQQARIKRVYIGTTSNLKSNQEIMKSIFQNKEFYHQVDYEYLDSTECSSILTIFFANKR